MTREYKERGRKPFDYKFKSFDPVIESKNFRIIICESLQEKNTDGVTRDPAENDLVILRFADEHTYEIFGVVEETERTSLSDKEGFYIFLYFLLYQSFTFILVFKLVFLFKLS